MSSVDRLSYLQSNESDLDFSTIINPCKSLTDVFNSVCEEGEEPEHLKVFLRIRPLLSEENITSQDGNVEILNGRNILLTAPSGSHAFKSKPQGITKVAHKFTFSHVYGQESTQKDLFEDTTQDLVKELINGNNCLLFTYGATNSGKTYTIQGTNVNPGLLPRTLDTLFRIIGDQQYLGNDLRPQHFCGVVRLSNKEVLKEEEHRYHLLKLTTCGSSLSRSTCSSEGRLSKDTDVYSVDDTSSDSVRTSDLNSNCHSIFDGIVDDENAFYAVFVSFAEIYNEYIYDLLDRSTLSKNKKKSPLVLGEDRHGAIYIKGLREVRVKSTDDALQILEVGKQSLRFAATRLNHHSSRSHCIFTLKLVRLADPSHPHVARVSMLSLCDLAGAERASKTLNSMDRLKEASNINTSLLVLGRCLTALRQNQMMSKQVCGPKKSVPIPYRDSKVTRLFQSFFMGKGKVALIVNISMSNLLFDETLKVLKFSALASKVTITQEKPQVADQSIEYKRNSQFSRLFRQSFNMSANSSRLSVPWSNKSIGDITFGGMEEKENNKLIDVPEVDEEEDEKYEALVQLIDKLKEKLVKVNQEKVELEANLRKELCDAFSKKIVQIEESWRSRIDEQEVRAGELMDWRINHVLGSVKKNNGARKRLRQESDDEEEMVPSILLVREEIKVKELEDANSQMEEEIDALKASLKSQIQTTKAAQEEKSKIIFQLAENSRFLDQLEEQKKEVEDFLERKSSSTCIETTNQLVNEELHHKIKSLEKCLQEKNLELKDAKDMLLEAFEDFEKKELQIKVLTSSLSTAKDTIARQSVLMQELESQLNETKDMLASQGEYLEEREQEIHDLRREDSNKSDVVDLENTYEEKQSREEKMEAIFREKSDLAVELEKAKSDLKKTEQLLWNEKETNIKLDNEKHDLETEFENVKREFVDLQKKYINLEKKTCQLESEYGDLQLEYGELKEAEIENNHFKIKCMEADLSLADTKLNESEKEKLELADQVAVVQCQIKKMEEGSRHLEEKYSKVNTENELLLIKIAELEIRLEAAECDQKEDDLSKILEDKDKKIETMSIYLDELKNDIDIYVKKMENLEETLVLKEQMEKENWVQVNAMREIIDRHSNEKESKVKKCQEVEDALSAKEEECQNLLLEIKGKEEECKNLLQEKKDLLNEKLELGNNLKNLDDRLKNQARDQEEKYSRLNISFINIKKEHEETQKELEMSLANVTSNYEACLLKAEEEMRQAEKLKLTISDLEDKNTKLGADLEIVKQAKIDLKNEVRELNTLVGDADMIKRRLIEKEITLEEDRAKAYSRVHHLEESLEEKQELINKLNAKVEYLDRKVNEADDEIEVLRSKIPILEKEVAALREARNEEVSHLRSEIEEKENISQQKDEEIDTLQQEMKRMLQMSIVSDLADKESTKISELKEQLRISEVERCSLHEQISSLQQEISCVHDMSKSTQFSLQCEETTKSKEQKSVRETVSGNSRSSRLRERRVKKEPSETLNLNSVSVVKNSETSEVESIANETPAKSRQTRSTRTRRTKKELKDYVITTPDNLKLSLDTSEGEDFGVSLSKNTSVKGSRKKCPSKIQKNSLTVSPEVDFKVPPQSRKKNTSCRFDLDDDEEDGDNEYVPETKPKNKRATKGRQKSVAKPIYNPHLENKENTECLKTSYNESIEENHSLSKAESESAARSRTRRRRPLYNLDDIDRFECSPDLIQQERVDDSPRTIVRRTLRSKIK